MSGLEDVVRPLTVAIVGPTATGKSDLALDLAEELGGTSQAEVINADAMQLYRGMDIGTAKLSPEDRRGFIHHQLDVLEVQEEASVAAYQKWARADLADIHSRGKHAVIVGGSGLYLRALLDVIDFPPTDPVVRGRLENELHKKGADALHQRLTLLDPRAAESINPANGRRIVRALEVISLTGRPYSATLPRHEYQIPAVQIGLRADPDRLDARIGERAKAMFANGLLEEVRGLEAKGLREGKTAQRATGYAQALAVLDGTLTEEEGIEKTALATRQLARRQKKWFRKDPRIHWLDTDMEPDQSQSLASRALQVALEQPNV